MSGATWTRISTTEGPRWQSAQAVREEVSAELHGEGARALVISRGRNTRWEAGSDGEGLAWRLAGAVDAVEAFEASLFDDGDRIQVSGPKAAA